MSKVKVKHFTREISCLSIRFLVIHGLKILFQDKETEKVKGENWGRKVKQGVP